METKQCGRCKEIKPIIEFCIRKSGRNKGYYDSYCKNCKPTYLKKWHHENIEKVRLYKSKQAKNWRKNHSEEAKIKDRYRHSKYKEKDRANDIIHKAIQRGHLKKPKRCEFCLLIKSLEAHHEYYNKPLEVIWLCKKCHNEWHKWKKFFKIKIAKFGTKNIPKEEIAKTITLSSLYNLGKDSHNALSELVESIYKLFEGK